MRISKVALRGYRISSAWLLLIGLKLQMLEREKKEEKEWEKKKKKNLKGIAMINMWMDIVSIVSRCVSVYTQ